MRKNLIVVLLAALLFIGTAANNSMAIEVGDEAPDFTVQSTSGEISLSEYRGEKNVVLALYFFINTPV
jgi:hypothetical protein